ncbi:MAG: glucosaminidase domain-containing protein [Alphaproteobacteria bacterium]|nr:glucosaminidase domain-containing protein [Alphaproteobacteria bacterium]
MADRRISAGGALCGALGALTLLALAVQPHDAVETESGAHVWRIDLALREMSAAGLRWGLFVPGLPPAPDEALDGPLLWPAPAAATASIAAPERALVDMRSYTLEAVRDGSTTVPRLLLDRLPTLLTRVESADLRKRLFIKALLPTLLAENERILARRARLLEIAAARDEGVAMSDVDRTWLEEVAETYGTEGDDLDELLRRVDAVPPSLAIAQAALESGWGTSRSAQQSHSMFGQMMLVGAESPRATVRPFQGLGDAVAAYVHNLNTHRAYAPMRERRLRARNAGQAPDGHELAGELVRYSERGPDYVRDVRVMIRTNRLEAFDRARLDG